MIRFIVSRKIVVFSNKQVQNHVQCIFQICRLLPAQASAISTWLKAGVFAGRVKTRRICAVYAKNSQCVRLPLLIFSLSFFSIHEVRHANKPMTCYLSGEFTRTQNCTGYSRRGLMMGKGVQETPCSALWASLSRKFDARQNRRPRAFNFAVYRILFSYFFCFVVPPRDRYKFHS